MDTDSSNLGGSSSDILPTLTEVTFRPHSTRCCSFTAVVREGKMSLSASLPNSSRALAIRHTSSRPSFGGAALPTTAEAGRAHVDAMHTRPQEGKAMHAQALASQGSEPSSGDNSGLSDSNPDLSSDDDRCSSKDNQGLSTGVNIPWDPVDEQRLLA
ncbi:hypothetical protein BDZ45DRAFT_733262 [Acephala macrosclerotiorum]|nr:hypothetical protein BDZ45DRAFT_733262 [Acephala macrosclerotiorum]